MGPIPAIILAGGAARRMGGGDKPLMTLAGESMLARIVARLHPQAAPLLLNANGAAGRFAAYGLPILPDPVLPGVPALAGPLLGILAALRWGRAAGHRWVATVPGDTPFLPPDLVARLMAGRGGAPACCAASDGRVHPVVAVWSTALDVPIAAALAAGERRVGMAVQDRTVVSWPGGGADDPFLNINTPTELARAAPLAVDATATQPLDARTLGA